MNYELLMQRCVAIGNSALGHTYPNPNGSSDLQRRKNNK